MVGAGEEIFVFWFTRTQENAFPGAFLRYTTAHLKMHYQGLPKTLHYSGEKWGGHGPSGCVGPVKITL